MMENKTIEELEIKRRHLLVDLEIIEFRMAQLRGDMKKRKLGGMTVKTIETTPHNPDYKDNQPHPLSFEDVMEGFK
jgi:hypothetical protein